MLKPHDPNRSEIYCPSRRLRSTRKAKKFSEFVFSGAASMASDPLPPLAVCSGKTRAPPAAMQQLVSRRQVGIIRHTGGGRGAGVADRAALEMPCTFGYRGFESRPLRWRVEWRCGASDDAGGAGRRSVGATRGTRPSLEPRSGVENHARRSAIPGRDRGRPSRISHCRFGQSVVD